MWAIWALALSVWALALSVPALHLNVSHLSIGSFCPGFALECEPSECLLFLFHAVLDCEWCERNGCFCYALPLTCFRTMLNSTLLMAITPGMRPEFCKLTCTAAHKETFSTSSSLQTSFVWQGMTWPFFKTVWDGSFRKSAGVVVERLRVRIPAGVAE